MAVKGRAQMPNLGLKQAEKKQMYPYKEARIKDSGGDLTKIWYVIYYAFNIDTEQLERKRLILSGITPADRYSEGEELVRKVNNELKKGAFISRKKKPEPAESEKPAAAKRLSGDMTITEASIYFMEQKHASLSDTTMKGYRGMMKRFLAFCKERRWHRIAIKKFDTEMAFDFFDAMAIDEDIQNKTYNNYIGLIGGMFNFFQKRDIIKRNPCENIDQLPVSSGGHIPFTVEQARALKDLMLSKGNGQLWLFCACMYYTFCRPGKELRFLKVKDVLVDHIRIDRTNSKSRKAKHVVIPAGLEKILQELNIRNFPREHYVFNTSGHPGPSPVGAVYFYRHHRKMLVELGLTDHDYDMYSWKHTGNIAAYLAGADLMYLRDQNGHHSVSQTERYLKDLGMIRVKTGIDHHPAI
jgi:integrase